MRGIKNIMRHGTTMYSSRNFEQIINADSFDLDVRKKYKNLYDQMRKKGDKRLYGFDL